MSCLSAALALCTALTGDVYRVVDGDTIRSSDGTYVRLLELDTPENGWRAECDAERMLAVHATAHLKALLAPGFEVEPQGQDRYRRTLAHIRLQDGRTASEAMVSDGFGVVYAGRVHDWCGEADG